MQYLSGGRTLIRPPTIIKNNIRCSETKREQRQENEKPYLRGKT